MKKILIVGALSQELNIIKEEIKKLELRDVKTSFLSVGIGNYNMILNLTRFLEKQDFDLVINIGVCGHTFSNSKQEKCIQIARIYNLANQKELLIPKIIKFAKSKSIISSEKIIFKTSSLLLDETENEVYVDMESYGFEMVCNNFCIPRIILKIPVDKIGKETKNFDFIKAENNLRKHIDYKALFIEIEKYIENHFNIGKGKYKIHYEIIEKYNIFFKFTFSENEKFKRLYYRYIALVKKEFNIFFDKNKSLNKKEFLIKLEKYLNKYLIK